MYWDNVHAVTLHLAGCQTHATRGPAALNVCAVQIGVLAGLSTCHAYIHKWLDPQLKNHPPGVEWSPDTGPVSVLFRLRPVAFGAERREGGLEESKGAGSDSDVV